MNTVFLEEFIVLANMLNYSKAADALFISQPVLSRHIKELENEVGHRLLHRDTHGVALTEEGKYLLKWAMPFIEMRDQTLSSMAEELPEDTYTVRMICSEQVITTPILTFIHSFIETYPDIHPDIIPLLGDESKEDMYACDIMLTSASFMMSDNSDISFRHLMHQDALLAIPPGHHLGDRQEIKLTDLSGETLIVPFINDIYGPYVRNSVTALRKCHGTIKRIGVENAQAGLLRVELGAGVMLMPHHLKHRVYPHTRTVTVADPDCIFPVYAYLNKTNENRAAEIFYEKICSRFSDK